MHPQIIRLLLDLLCYNEVSNAFLKTSNPNHMNKYIKRMYTFFKKSIGRFKATILLPVGGSIPSSVLNSTILYQQQEQEVSALTAAFIESTILQDI